MRCFLQSRSAANLHRLPCALMAPCSIGGCAHSCGSASLKPCSGSPTLKSKSLSELDCNHRLHKEKHRHYCRLKTQHRVPSLYYNYSNVMLRDLEGVPAKLPSGTWNYCTNDQCGNAFPRDDACIRAAAARKRSLSHQPCQTLRMGPASRGIWCR